MSMAFNREKFQLAYQHARGHDSYNVANRLLPLAIKKDAPEACTILFPDAWSNSQEGWCSHLEIRHENDTYFNSGACDYIHSPYSLAMHYGSLRALQALVEFNKPSINNKCDVRSTSYPSHSIGSTSPVAIAVNSNNLSALAILLSSYCLIPNDFVSSPESLDDRSPFTIALKRGHHQAAQMLILHPNFNYLTHPSVLAEDGLQQHTSLLKARELSNQARVLLNEKKIKECQRLFQEALNISPEVVYNDAVYLVATQKDKTYTLQLMTLLLQCESRAHRFLELNEYLGIEIFNNKDQYPDYYKLAATFLAKARLSHDANRMLLTCYYQLESKTFPPTQVSLETLLSDPTAREVILRGHIQVKLFSNRLTGAKKNITDTMLTLFAAEITDPILLIEFCVDNEMSNPANNTADCVDIDKIYQRFLNLTTVKSPILTLANSLSRILDATKAEGQQCDAEGAQARLDN